ncbi:arrestin domain-containing protein 17-like [Procambarus clarkii]|uniref:arrestin domain-containing protein 17-like n=1 Tax=Procambarus clarkii TaxID=6728 RepID=UPI00374343F1
MKKASYKNFYAVTESSNVSTSWTNISVYQLANTPMVRPQRFEIQFDVPSGVYFSKQTITGNVVLQVAEPLNLKGVKMRFLGECCIHFTDYPKGLENLRPGRKGWKEARRKPAARDSPVDSLHAKWTPSINRSSSASGSDVKNLCCFCCKTGPITLAVHIPRRGYVPGEKILVSAEADNLSSKNTRRTRLQLVQVMKYIMPNGVKELEEERVLKEIVRGIIPPGESDVWENVAITVPPIVPANVHLTCRLLHVQYRLDMLLELSAPLSALQVSLPITIGTVPLRKRFSTFLPPGETRKPCRLPGIKYPDYPSYWFGECILGQECLETQYERVTGMQENYGPQFEPMTSFAPKYICYTEGNNVDDESRGRRLGQTIT